MFISSELLSESLKPFGLTLTDEQIQKLDVYARMLFEYNQKVNLTAISDPDGILIKHFVDSLALLKYVDIPQKASIADVGTGAGFPGLVLLIARPDINASLFDSTKKKLAFVETVIDELNLKGETVHMRAEEAGQGAYRESFDIVTARAVAELRVLCELCLPLVKKGGLFCPMKGSLSKEEEEAGFSAIAKLGARTEEVFSYKIPPEDRRTLINIRKISQTSVKYPRIFTQILKNPL